MKTLRICSVLTALIVCFATTGARAENPSDILKKMDNVIYMPKDQISHVTMVLTDRSGNERVREAKVWQKGSDKRLFRFTAPAAEAGITFLSLPNDVMYVYMPAFGKERRIASHVKNQSFAGTDLTYEDLEAKEYAKTYSPKLLATNETTYTLELVPLPTYRSDYSKLIVTVNRRHYYPETMEAYDRAGNKIRSSKYTWKQADGFWYMHEITTTDLRRNHSTRMTINRVEFNTNIDDQVFTVRNLVQP